MRIYRFEKAEAWAQSGWSFGRRTRFFQALLSDVLPLGSLHTERHERSCILDLLPDSRIRSATAKTVQKKTIWGSALDFAEEVESWEQLLSSGSDVSRRDFTRHDP
jgi:hypothetical protein